VLLYEGMANYDAQEKRGSYVWYEKKMSKEHALSALFIHAPHDFIEGLEGVENEEIVGETDNHLLGSNNLNAPDSNSKTHYQNLLSRADAIYVMSYYKNNRFDSESEYLIKQLFKPYLSDVNVIHLLPKKMINKMES